MKTNFVEEFDFIATPKNTRWIRDAMSYRFNILEGTVRSGKDFCAIPAFIERIKVSKNNLFMICGVSAERAYSIVGSIILAYCSPFAKKVGYAGADAILFQYKGRDIYILIKGGSKAGADEQIRGLTLGGLYFTEINLLHPDFISQAIKRLGASIDPFVFGTLNPREPEHWFYKEYLFLWAKE